MTPPNPALVSQRDAEPLPRLALLLLCAAYVLPGLFGREPWKSADITAFGYIVNIAHGRTSWLAPQVASLPADGVLLPYWLGAVFVKALPSLDAALAARIPFALLLALTLALVWYATYWLARLESAQPLPLAFGGEARPVDYARAIADGAVLAVIASLGLLQLGHETTPELVQLFAVALFLYGLAAAPHGRRRGLVATVVALPILAASGAPATALLLALAALLALLGAQRVAASADNASAFGTTTRRGPLAAPSAGASLDESSGRPATPLASIAAIALGALLALGAALVAGAWANRLGTLRGAGDVAGMVKNLAWFAWPSWLLAVWTLWQWRRRLFSAHLAVAVACAAALLAVWIGMTGADRPLMLALLPIAILAAFALPTLQRSVAAGIDWFSVFFFTIAAATGWVFYVAIQTGTPAKLAANVAKLSPDYARTFSPLALAFALAASAAWLWVVRWRVGRHRHPVWKSLVLPAAGVALCWLLVMTLLLPPLDNARSYRSMMARMTRIVPKDACIAGPGLSRAQLVALETAGWSVDGATAAARSPCRWLLVPAASKPVGAPWQPVGRVIRNRNDTDAVDVYRKSGA